MKLTGKTIAVTGAGGFLGSYLIPRLLDRGCRVVAIDNFSVGTPDRLKSVAAAIEIVNADIRHPRDLEEPLGRAQIVYHLAAIANPRAAARDFQVAFEINATGTFHVLSLSSHAERFIFSSTVTVYGQPSYLPIDERHPLNAADPYGASKIIGEQLVRSFHHLHSIPYTIVRNSNIFGPGQSAEYLIPTLILQGLTKPPIEIWDPTPIRDFLFVEDAAEALVRLAECQAAAGETVNLGSGQGIATGELADLIAYTLGTTWVDVHKPAPVSGKLICDNSRLRALTGWRLQVSLEDGIRRTVEHFRQRLTTVLPKP